MFLLALSCLQGHSSIDAARQLWTLSPDGLQLTPGCSPSAEFLPWLTQNSIPVSTHHGYTPTALRRPVWSADGTLTSTSDSIHPPKRGHPAEAHWLEQVLTSQRRPIVEVMYPGWCLSGTRAIAEALDAELNLAVDVSHLHIQRSAGALDDTTLRRLLESPLVTEVHLSANDGRRDLHHTADITSWGFGWATERSIDGIPLIYEAYLHRVDHQTRKANIEAIRDAIC